MAAKYFLRYYTGYSAGGYLTLGGGAYCFYPFKLEEKPQ
jgi:hypothetical protein